VDRNVKTMVILM